MSGSDYEPKLPTAVAGYEKEVEEYEIEALAPQSQPQPVAQADQVTLPEVVEVENEGNAVVAGVSPPQPPTEVAGLGQQPQQPGSPGEWVSKSEYDAMAERLAALEAEVGSQPYKVLKGKYSKEVPEMAEQIRNLSKQVEALRSPPVPAVERYTSAEEREMLGDEAVSINERLARGVSEEQSEPLRADVAEVRAKNEELASELRQFRFESALSGIVPDWRAINNGEYRQKWLAWLAQKEPLAGVSRQRLLQDAETRMDVQQVGSIFNAFKQSQGMSVTQSDSRQTTSNQQDAQAAPSAKLPTLADQVVPAQNQGASRAPPQEQRLTWRQYEAFCDKICKDRKFRDSERAQKMEAIFNAAIANDKIEGAPGTSRAA